MTDIVYALAILVIPFALVFGISLWADSREDKTINQRPNMYVYIRSEPGLWTVGFYDPEGMWHPDSDYNTPEEAAKRVHFLNGGN